MTSAVFASPWSRGVGLAMLVGLLAVPLVARADVVELTNGQRLVGKVVDATATTLVIQVRGKEMRIRQDRVRALTFDGDPSTDAPADTSSHAASAPAADAVPPKAETPASGPLPIPVAAALTLLDGLQEATAKPLAPAEYAARVDAVKREVNEALRDAPEDRGVRTAIAAAVQYHAFAAHAGQVYEDRGDFAALGRDPVVTECGALTDLITRDAAQLHLNARDPAVAGLVTATEGAAPLRECAGEKIAEAESRARAVR